MVDTGRKNIKMETLHQTVKKTTNLVLCLNRITAPRSKASTRQNGNGECGGQGDCCDNRTMRRLFRHISNITSQVSSKSQRSTSNKDSQVIPTREKGKFGQDSWVSKRELCHVFDGIDHILIRFCKIFNLHVCYTGFEFAY